MQAAFITAPGRIELREAERPVPGPGDVLVKVRSCGICGSDLHTFNGVFPTLGFCPGHEISGEVVAIGGSPTQVQPGDRVAIEAFVGCGKCWCCRTGNYQLCGNFRVAGATQDGGFAEYVCMPAYALYPLPAAVDCDLGALTEPLAVAVHAVRQANVHGGDRVVILGAGTIGLMCAAAAKAAGAAEVWITARHSHQGAAAQLLGATRVFLGHDPDGDLLDAAGRMLVDSVIETVGGTADTVNQALQLVRPGGSIAVLGVFSSMPSLNVLSLMMKEVHLIGSMTYNRSGQRADFDIALQLLAAQPERYGQLITHRFPLSEIIRGFETAADKRSGSVKVAILPP
jgi:L-iditol 2-dehydrogenase